MNLVPSATDVHSSMLPSVMGGGAAPTAGSPRAAKLATEITVPVLDSYRSAGNHNAAEVSPLQLYLRLFGTEFAGANEKGAAPDPRLLLRQSVLSGVKDDRDRLAKGVGSTDKARLDQYFFCRALPKSKEEAE